jgi:hypothetical protein
MTLVRGLYAHAAVDGPANPERSLARAGMSQLPLAVLVLVATGRLGRRYRGGQPTRSVL